LALFGLNVDRAVLENDLMVVQEGLFSGCFGSATCGKFALEGSGILKMLIVAYCEVMCSVKGRTCTEIDIIVLLWIQNSLQTSLGRYIDRSRRETDMFICIVRRIHSEMLLQDTVKSVVIAECYGRVRL
jgi:hypothetical protein